MVDSTGLEQLVCFQLYAASRTMTAIYRPALDPHGLTYPQYLALRILWHRGPTTIRDLGKHLDLDSGTLSPLLKRLETAGHVRRERSTTDERTVEVHRGNIMDKMGAQSLAHLVRMHMIIQAGVGTA